MMMRKSRQDLVAVRPPVQKKTKIAILGGDERAKVLLSLFCELEDVEVVAVAHNDLSAPGMALARRRHIPTLQHCRDLSELDVDVIVETAGDGGLHACIAKCKPVAAELISEQSAQLILSLLEAGKRGREQEKLLTQLSEA